MGVPRPGFALIIVLVVSAAVFALAMEGGVRARLAVEEAVALREQAQLRRDAESAAAIAIAALTAGASSDSGSGGGGAFGDDSDSGGVDADDVEEPDIPELPAIVRDMLSDDIDDAKQQDGDTPDRIIRDRPGSRSGPDALDLLRARGAPAEGVPVTVNDRRFRVRLVDKGGLLNLNTADEEQLRRYLARRGVDESTAITIAHQLMDWRDEDDFVRPRGAEKGRYQYEGVSIRNGPLRSVRELLFLPAMSRGLYARIKDDCTVYGEGKVHVGTAPRSVLLSVPDMTPEIAESIISLRKDGNLSEATFLETISVAEMKLVDSFTFKLSSLLSVRVDAEDRDIAPFTGTAVVGGDSGVVLSRLMPDDSLDRTLED